jgi:tripartite-type tricarboxylate transporter receptor subunit TctC
MFWVKPEESFEAIMAAKHKSNHEGKLMLLRSFARGVLAACAVAAFPFCADAQTYPAKPVRIIVPFGPGGASDQLPRLLGPGLASIWNQQVIIDNRPGAAGNIGMEQIAKAPADGYTLGSGPIGNLAVNPHLFKLTFDIFKDFTPITMMGFVENGLVVHPSIPANSVQELIAYAKANPGKLSYASQGTGASGHIAAELLKLHAGIDIVHIPYRGAAPAAQDLAAGHVSMMFDVVSLALPQIQAGRVRPLAVSAKERVAVLPDVPTLIELGMDAEVGAWFGMLGPASTSPQAVAWLNREATKVFSVPDTRNRFVQQGAAMPLGTPESFGQFIQTESDRYGGIIKRAGIKLE